MLVIRWRPSSTCNKKNYCSRFFPPAGPLVFWITPHLSGVSQHILHNNCEVKYIQVQRQSVHVHDIIWQPDISGWQCYLKGCSINTGARPTVSAQLVNKLPNPRFPASEWVPSYLSFRKHLTLLSVSVSRHQASRLQALRCGLWVVYS